MCKTTPLQTTESTYDIVACFANDNTRNVCYHTRLTMFTLDEMRRFHNFVDPDYTRRTFFGDAAEATTGIELTDLDRDGYTDVVTIEQSGHVRIYRGTAYTQQNFDFSHIVPEPLDGSRARDYVSENAVQNGRRMQSRTPADLTGEERFMSNTKLAIGRCSSCFGASFIAQAIDFETTTLSRRTRDAQPAKFLITHHYSPNTRGGSCAMRCHEAGRMGYDSFKLFESFVVGAVDQADVNLYDASGEPTACLCGGRFDAMIGPDPPPAPPDTPPPPPPPPPDPPSQSPHAPPPSPPFPIIRCAPRRAIRLTSRC